MPATWGYSGTVGEWFGFVQVAEERRSVPLSTLGELVSQLEVALGPWHRPATLALYWGEFDEGGQNIDFHEDDPEAVDSWAAVRERILALSTKSPHRVGVGSIFIELDVQIQDEHGEEWFQRASEITVHVNHEVELAPDEVTFSYRTYVDAWLAVTVGETGDLRPNHRVAERNRARMESSLAGLTHIAGRSLQVEPTRFSQYVTPTGFLPSLDGPARAKEPNGEET